MGRKRNAITNTAEEEIPFVSSPSARTWITGGDIYATDLPQRRRSRLSRFIVTAVSSLLFCAGTTIVVLTAVQRSQIIPLCESCSQLITVSYCVGSSLTLIGIIGVVATVFRRRPIVWCLTTLLVLMALALLAGGIFIVVYNRALSSEQIKAMWTHTLRDDAEMICELQKELSCSGFDHCCIDWGATIETSVPSSSPMTTTSANSTTTEPSSTVPVPAEFPWPNPCNITQQEFDDQCSMSCNVNGLYNTTCDISAKNFVQSHLAVFLGVAFGAAFFLIIIAVFSVRMAPCH